MLPDLPESAELPAGHEIALPADSKTPVAVAPTGGPTRAGTVAIVGRPNVGKSTLLNRLVGQKISITSRKAQTTRHRITGILTRQTDQFIFVDTPGFQIHHKSALNRSMNRTVRSAMSDVDVILFVIEAGRFGADDRIVSGLLPDDGNVVLVLNKSDTVKDKTELLPFLQERAAERDYAAMVPVSAKTGLHSDALLDAIAAYLPFQDHIFGPDELTDRNERFLVSEIIREKVFRLLGEELPYGCTVVIDKFDEEVSRRDGGRFPHIYATILVERDNHKAMIIGTGGAKLKQIGTDARHDIEKLLDARVHLELWIKVKSGWADSDALIKSYGYE